MTELLSYVRCYDHAFPDEFCDRMVRTFEECPQHHVENGANARAGLELSRWTELDVTKLSNPHFQGYVIDNIKQYKSRYEADCGISPPLPAPSALAALIMKRYQPGGSQGFQPHFDSVREVCNRYLVYLWYMNDLDAGGETHFVDLDYKVEPVKGRLLMFPPYWMYRHAGLPPASGPKYIVSTYLLW